MRWLRTLVLLLAAAVSASSLPHTDADTRPKIRAAWVTRWAFKSPDDVRRIFADLSQMGINTVFFQVRGACDALYESTYEPWSPVLTGSLGKDPGWDPLKVALDEGHRLGVEVHAWMNLFPAWPVSDTAEGPPTSVPLHVFRAHPEWLARDAAGNVMSLLKTENASSYVFLSPTHPGVQQHIEAVVEDLVARYGIDGLHLDYARFPDSSYSYDAASLWEYRLDDQPGDLSYTAWRRENLTRFVGRLAGAARRIDPRIKVSAAVWQKVDDGMARYLQDSGGWVGRGYIDFTVPMIYTVDEKAFEQRLRDHCNLSGAEHVVAGLGPYLDGFTDSLMVDELGTVRGYGVLGFAVFNSDYAVKYGSVIRAYGSEN